MTKLVVFVCILFVAIADHDARAGFLMDSIAEGDRLADTAIKTAEDSLAIVKGTTDMLTQTIGGIFNMFIMEVRKQVTRIVDKVDNEILGLIGAVNDPKVSDCAELAETLHYTADAKIANVSHCAIELLAKVDGYIQFIYNMTGETLSEIKLLKKELKSCTTGVSSFDQILGFFFCAEKVAVEAGILTARKIPKISAYVSELETFVRGLPTSLPLCIATNGILTLVEKASDIFIGVQSCALELIGGTTTQKPKAPELLGNSAGDEKRPGLQAYPKQPGVRLVRTRV